MEIIRQQHEPAAALFDQNAGTAQFKAHSATLLQRVAAWGSEEDVELLRQRLEEIGVKLTT